MKNTLEDLFGKAFEAKIHDYVLGIPAEPPTLTSTPFEPQVNEVQLSALFDLALVFGAELARSPMILATFDACAQTSPFSAQCAPRLLEAIASNLFRRPSESSPTVAGIVSGFQARGANQESFELALAQLLLTPNFILHVEQAEAANGAEVQLDQYSIANRISYAATQSLPDRDLAQDAAAGKLTDRAVRRTHIERLLRSERGRTTIRGFFNDWLGFGDITTGPENDHFLNGDVAAAKLTELKDEGLEEAFRYIDHVLFTKGGKFEDLITGKETFTTSPTLAKIYETQVSDGTTPKMGALGRGILLRYPNLSSSVPTNDIIMRGLTFQTRVLCRQISDPPEEIIGMRLAAVGEWDPKVHTNRDRIRILTAEPTCMACHNQINPPGFGLENFDAIGRYITTERLYDEDGNYIISHPVDSATELTDLSFSSPAPVAVKSGLELVEKISQSEVAKLCVNQKFYRFASYSREDLKNNADVCNLVSATQAMAEKDGSFLDALVKVIELRSTSNYVN